MYFGRKFYQVIFIFMVMVKENANSIEKIIFGGVAIWKFLLIIFNV